MVEKGQVEPYILLVGDLENLELVSNPQVRYEGKCFFSTLYTSVFRN